MQIVSKSQLKSQLLEYLRTVEEKQTPLVVTHGGKPVVRILPYQEDPDAVLKSLHKSVLAYKDPFRSVGEEAWEGLR